MMTEFELCLRETFIIVVLRTMNFAYGIGLVDVNYKRINTAYVWLLYFNIYKVLTEALEKDESTRGTTCSSESYLFEAC